MIARLSPVLLFCLCLTGLVAHGQSSATRAAVLSGIYKSASAWNSGNLTGFMAVYDASATMMLSGGRVGVDSMRHRYLKKYFSGSKCKQQLSYDHFQFTPLGPDYLLLTGRYLLKAAPGLPQLSGPFSLIFKKTGTRWLIIHDQSG